MRYYTHCLETNDDFQKLYYFNNINNYKFL